jgi:hypothetical protein
MLVDHLQPVGVRLDLRQFVQEQVRRAVERDLAPKPGLAAQGARLGVVSRPPEGLRRRRLGRL